MTTDRHCQRGRWRTKTGVDFVHDVEWRGLGLCSAKTSERLEYVFSPLRLRCSSNLSQVAHLWGGFERVTSSSKALAPRAIIWNISLSLRLIALEACHKLVQPPLAQLLMHHLHLHACKNSVTVIFVNNSNRHLSY